MDLDQRDGKLRVHYGDRLVTLMREVRQLSALGFAVPAKIQQTASTANKFYRHGMILKQVKSHCVVGTVMFLKPEPHLVILSADHIEFDCQRKSRANFAID